MAVLAFLEEFRKQRRSNPNRGTFTESEEDRSDGMLKKPLVEFSQANCALKVNSGVLGEDVFFVSNPKCFQLIDSGYVTYTADELMLLVRMGVSQDTLRKLHAAKRIFGAEITGGKAL